jgi:hypothetical protein
MWEGSGDVKVEAGGVREQDRKANMERGTAQPEIKPESSGNPITNGHNRDGAKLVNAGEDVLSNGGVKIVVVPHIMVPVPAVLVPKPASPRSRGVRMKLCEKLSEESGVLGLDR